MEPQIPSEEKKIPWYYKSGSIVIAFLCVGPLALPLVWFNPRMSVTKKIIWSVVIAVLSYFLAVMTIESFKKISQYYEQMKTIMA